MICACIAIVILAGASRMSNLQHQIQQLIQRSDVPQALMLCGQACRRHPVDLGVWQLQAQLPLKPFQDVWYLFI